MTVAPLQTGRPDRTSSRSRPPAGGRQRQALRGGRACPSGSGLPPLASRRAPLRGEGPKGGTPPPRALEPGNHGAMGKTASTSLVLIIVCICFQ